MNKRRKYAQNFSAFKLDIDTPNSGVGSYRMRANARMAVSFNADVSDGDLTVLVNNRQFPIPELSSGIIHFLDYIEKDRLISFTSKVAGSLNLYVLDQWNRVYKVADSAGPVDAFTQAVVSLGGTVSGGRKTLLNTTVFTPLVSSGLWAKLNRFGLMAAENSQSAVVDLRDPSKVLTPVGAPVFAADQGYTGGAGKHLDTGYIVPTDLYLQDSAHYSVGTLSTRAVGSDVCAIGNVQLPGGSGLYFWTSADTATGTVNTDNVFAGPYAHPGASVKGFYTVSRTGSVVQKRYYNSALVNTDDHVSAAPPVGKSFLIGAWRNNDGVSVYANDSGIMPVWTAGAALSDSEAAQLSEIVNNYMTAISNPLY